MDFKWIGFLIEWILNGLDYRQNGLIRKIRFFAHPYLSLVLLLFIGHEYNTRIRYNMYLIYRYIYFENNKIQYVIY